jgi:glutathione synthase/RimK-type ligase-like ATP-grasp enzyme
MKLQFAGIRRNSQYSPNQITNDGLILLKTAQELMKLGIDYKIYEESEITDKKINENIIFTMARGIDTLNILSEMEEHGKLIINSPKASINCYRVNMSAKLKAAGIPFPKSKIVNTSSNENYNLSDVGKKKIWIKRGDVHAIHREDVSIVYGDEELNFILKEFAHRGITEAILQEHIPGDVIKFYVVRGTDFFRWYYLNESNNYQFDVSYLKELSEKSAELLNLIIYGGDAIISENGSITIIDINDWPSFANFRDEASLYIAKRIYSESIEVSKLSG